MDKFGHEINLAIYCPTILLMYTTSTLKLSLGVSLKATIKVSKIKLIPQNGFTCLKITCPITICASDLTAHEYSIISHTIIPLDNAIVIGKASLLARPYPINYTWCSGSYIT